MNSKRQLRSMQIKDVLHNANVRYVRGLSSSDTTTSRTAYKLCVIAAEDIGWKEQKKVQSDIEKFVKTVKDCLPKKQSGQSYCFCPCCNGVIHIHRHTFDNQFYAICSNCKMTLRG